jgi:3-oxoacyl-[acyl-carrier protein] reductase
MDLELEGKSALVTGGERGIGRDICLSLAREGVNVAYCDVRLDRGEDSTLAAVEALGRKALAAEVDVAVEAQAVHGWRTRFRRWGRWTSSSAMPASSNGSR